MPDFSEYCRELESYLCRKNGGHLVRIVGPAFEQVCSWAERGVPLTVAYRGIDRYCERLQARAARRRPVRIEFCEGDILDLFEDWRRAVGVVQATAGAESLPAARKPALAAHLDRVVARLVGTRVRRSPVFEQHVEGLLAEIDRLSGQAKRSRGEELDRGLMQAATAELDRDAVATARREAEAELAAFGARMAPEVRAQAVEAALERLVRDTLGLPQVRYQ